jgi:hypothetical protein
MSCVCILTPIVIAGWPAFSAAVTAAAVSLGYTVAEEGVQKVVAQEKRTTENKVELQIEQSELVTGSLGRQQQISVSRGGVTITFSRDARGKASLCVSGQGHKDEALRAMGEELSKRVVQQYVYQRIMDELRSRQFMVVEEEVGQDRSIRMKVRHWEN